jgi:4-aminobutyrate aminotransferase
LISDVRGLGLLTALVLRRPDGSPATVEAEQVMYSALRKGLSFKTTMGSTIVLTPPLTIEEEHLHASIEILDQCLRELEQA